ncbi:PD-(D/E)XK nuclease family protein [Anaerococcus porci]|uniref:PD-(D/E)XK nuclease family protein n=1 Tax=Anaerococcus porci TaxID=2652269 RepID=UPI002A75B73D|nr:PD-(D/E)XK nuclease family protein [Anaerococcus porci]MDY3006421.1 PD-(D/E)XK nuclease family protein [Anaerococcus porci]
MINIIMSKFPEENSLYIYKEIENKLENKEKSFLIVPEQYTLESDMDFINSIKFNAVMDAKVLSFKSLITYLKQRLTINKKESLSKTSKTIIITSILYKLDDKLKIFSNKADDVDFVNELSEFFSNIKEYYFDDDFFKSIEENDNIDSMTRLKFKEIKLIYDKYCEKIKKTYLDSEDELSFIKENIKNCEFLKNTNFYFDKFDLLSDLRLDFIKELIKIGAKISVSISVDKEYYENNMSNDLSIFDQGFNFIERLKELDKIRIIPINKRDSFEDIKHLYENFEKYRPKIYPKEPQNIYFLESISSTNEVENASLIIEKLIREGTSFSSIAIVMANASEYENIIKRIFDRLNIAIFIDKSKKMTENSVLKTWLSLLRIIVFNFRKEDLESFIRSGLLDFGENSLQRVISFQNYMSERKIKGSMIFEDKYFELDEEYYEGKKELKDEKQKELLAVNSIRKSIVELIKPLYEYRKDIHKASELVNLIYYTLDNNIIKNGFRHYQDNIKEKDLSIYEENSQIWNKFMTILEQVVAILGEGMISLNMIYKLIEKACENTTISIIPPAIDQVLIGDFDKDRINDRDIKIFIGMNDLYFPNSNNSYTLISEKEKNQLKNENINLKIYEDNKDDKKLLNLLRMITTSKKIFFSYSLINKSNEAMNISSSLADIIQIFPKASIRKIIGQRYDLLKYSKDKLDEFSYANLWKVKRNEKIKDDEKNITRTYLKFKKDSKEDKIYNDAKTRSYDLFLKGFNYSKDKKILNKNIAFNLYNKNKFTVSEIEAYAKCPYKYFVNYGLKARDLESLDIDYMELGNIVHYNMEKISRKLINEDIDKIDKESLDKLVEDNFKQSIKLSLDKVRASDNKNKFILSNIYESSKNSSKKILEQIKQGGFKIDTVEEKYGKNQAYPEVYVDGKNYLEGRIDRIDKYGDYIRIIDYKTGSKDIKIENILNGIELQLFVYMISVKGKISEKSKDYLKPVASFYLPLKDEVKSLKSSYDKENIEKIYNDKLKMNGLIIKINEEVLKLLDTDYDGKNSDIFKIQRGAKNIFTVEEEEVLERFIKKLISNYIIEIKSGNIALNPIRINESTYECQICPYRSICKFDYSIDQDKFKDIDKNLSIKDIKKELDNE